MIEWVFFIFLSFPFTRKARGGHIRLIGFMKVPTVHTDAEEYGKGCGEGVRGAIFGKQKGMHTKASPF